MSTLPILAGGSVPIAERTDVLRSAIDYAAAEKSPATLRAYDSDWRHYEAWCKSERFAPLPTNDREMADSTSVLAAYLAHLADAGLKASTINRRSCAITYVFRKAGLLPPTGAETIKGLQRGIRRTIGTRVERKAPVTVEVLRAMLKRIPKTPSGLRDRALLLLCFASAQRRSEIVALDVEDLERVPEGILVHIRKSKTDQEGSGHQVAVPRGGKLKPVQAVEDWLAVSGITAGPLFRPVLRSGRVLETRLGDQSVADIVKRWAEAAGFDPEMFSGHSLRAGLVTSALAAGADPLKIMDITRHTQVQTLKAYDRRAKAFKDHAGKGFL